ncbi:MAG: mannose-1-phosphate guanylyltransferase, partial [candidate division Zixibacteria bacterium]|nr:mannose-1-phosphate guanylyltransferase [candidate division Zixibacteria bacterium]
ILAGGKGERFWPLSRISNPKQFLKLTSDRTMLEETIDRILPLIPIEQVRIVTGQSMRDFIFDNIDYLSEVHLLGEPVGRNTCTAIGLAAVHLQKTDPDAVMVVLSADHIIRPAERLLEILRTGISIASESDSLITIGIVPTRPETGYGYIKTGEPYEACDDGNVFNVLAFTEKPKAVVANQYYYSGNYLWNSGMFLWSVRSILTAISKCQPELGQLFEKYSESIGTDHELEARRQLYEDAAPISIDVAVLENAKNVLTMKADIVWDDIGGWNALSRYREVDQDNNVLIGDALTIDTYETTVYNNSDGLVACLGVADLVVVRCGDVVLVAHKTKVDE